MTFQLILDEIKNNLKKILDDLSRYLDIKYSTVEVAIVLIRSVSPKSLHHETQKKSKRNHSNAI